MLLPNGTLSVKIGEHTFHVRVAKSFLGRLLGLIGSRSLPDDAGLLLVPCSGIHTLMMTYPIDVLFLDASGRVLACCENVRPWRWGLRAEGARMALELPAGAVRRLGLAPGQRLRFVKVEAGGEEG